MSRFDFHSFVDLMRAAVAAGISPGTIDKMSELGFESIHDAASRSHTVDASLSAEIEALLATSGYTAHSPEPGGASPPRGPVPRFDQPAIRMSLRRLVLAYARAVIAAPHSTSPEHARNMCR